MMKTFQGCPVDSMTEMSIKFNLSFSNTVLISPNTNKDISYAFDAPWAPCYRAFSILAPFQQNVYFWFAVKERERERPSHGTVTSQCITFWKRTAWTTPTQTTCTQMSLPLSQTLATALESCPLCSPLPLDGGPGPRLRERLVCALPHNMNSVTRLSLIKPWAYY